MNRIFHQHFRFLSLPEHILIHLNRVLRPQHQRPRHVFRNPQHPVKRIRHVEQVGVVHKVENHQEFFPWGFPHTSAELLQVNGLGHRRSCHEQHFRVRGIPSLVQQVAGAEYRNIASLVFLQDLFPFLRRRSSGNASGVRAPFLEEIRDLLCMLYRSTENDGGFILHIFKPGIHKQFIPRRHMQNGFQILRIVLESADSHVPHVDIRFNPDAPDRYQRSGLHRAAKVQFVCHIPEQFQQVLPVRPFRRRRQAQREIRMEIVHHFPVGICCPVMAFVDHQIAEFIRPEVFQVLRHSLNSSADHVGIFLPCPAFIPSDRHLRP